MASRISVQGRRRLFMKAVLSRRHTQAAAWTIADYPRGHRGVKNGGGGGGRKGGIRIFLELKCGGRVRVLVLGHVKVSLPLGETY